jgi:hypothetical protein
MSIGQLFIIEKLVLDINKESNENNDEPESNRRRALMESLTNDGTIILSSIYSNVNELQSKTVLSAGVFAKHEAVELFPLALFSVTCAEREHLVAIAIAMTTDTINLIN